MQIFIALLGFVDVCYNYSPYGMPWLGASGYCHVDNLLRKRFVLPHIVVK